MKRLYGKGATHLLPAGGDLAFVVQQGTNHDKIVVAYKMYSFGADATSPVTRSVYLLNKFGYHFEFFEKKLRDFLTCQCLLLPERRALIVYPNGAAATFDAEHKVVWQGDIIHGGSGPHSLVLSGDSFWASFPKAGSIVRYNIALMREDLRVGGGDVPPFDRPEGLWAMDGNLLVCNAGSNLIRQLGFPDFTLQDYAEFEEPVHQYLRFGSREVVLLDSGIYEL